MKYSYLQINKNCKICNGSGITKWVGNDCHKCLKQIDLSNMHKFQLIELKKAIEINLRKEEI